ncbi:hypothetical protein D3C84_1207420 [compost metagenome]
MDSTSCVSSFATAVPASTSPIDSAARRRTDDMTSMETSLKLIAPNDARFHPILCNLSWQFSERR